MSSAGSSGDLTTLGDYRLEGELGAGAMGIVYRAVAPDGRLVAVKVMRPEFSRDETYAARFELESTVARDLRHPHVVPVLDAGTLDGTSFLVQPLIEGTSLERHLTDRGRLEVDETVRIVSEVASGLDAIAATGVVHRDVKPLNILLDTEGHAHLTDFGLARDLAATRRLTRPGQTLGSLDYMSPEQIQSHPLSPATDVYALGAVTFACLVGRPPFGDLQPMKIMLAHLDEEPPDVATLRPEVPAGISAAIHHALLKDPADRPPTAGSFAAALRAGR